MAAKHSTGACAVAKLRTVCFALRFAHFLVRWSVDAPARSSTGADRCMAMPAEEGDPPCWRGCLMPPRAPHPHSLDPITHSTRIDSPGTLLLDRAQIADRATTARRRYAAHRRRLENRADAPTARWADARLRRVRQRRGTGPGLLPGLSGLAPRDGGPRRARRRGARPRAQPRSAGLRALPPPASSHAAPFLPGQQIWSR
jgi:hypothetical protein